MSDGLLERTELLQRPTLLKRELAGIDVRFCVRVQHHTDCFCREDHIFLTVRSSNGHRIVGIARVVEWGKHLEARARGGRRDVDLTVWTVWVIYLSGEIIISTIQYCRRRHGW